MTNDAATSGPSSPARDPRPDTDATVRDIERRAVVERAHKIRSPTLVTLLVAVALLATCGAIAVPNFVKFACRAKQSEAKGNLRAIWNLRAQHPDATTLDALGFTPAGSKIRYQYALALDGSAAIAVASPKMQGELADDLWFVDAKTPPHALIDGCRF